MSATVWLGMLLGVSVAFNLMTWAFWRALATRFEREPEYVLSKVLGRALYGRAVHFCPKGNASIVPRGPWPPEWLQSGVAGE